jgi:hypothetical protein
MRALVLSALLFSISASATEPQLIGKVAGLNVPESAQAIPNSPLIVVSNMGPGNPDDPSDTRGFLALVTRDGKIPVPNWVTGLRSPKGVKIRGDFVYVAEVNAIAIASLSRHKPGLGPDRRIEVPGALLLNDLDFDSPGNLYVSDTFGEQIFAIQGIETASPRMSIIAAGLQLLSPNGVIVENDFLWVVGTDTFTGQVAGVPTNHGHTFAKGPKHGRLMVISLRTGQQTTMLAPDGGFDGVTIDKEGRVLVGEFGTPIPKTGPDGKPSPGGEPGKIFRFDPRTNQVEPLLTVPGELAADNPADIWLDRERGELLIPNNSGNELQIFKYTD